MHRPLLLLTPLAALMLSGCLVSSAIGTAASVATAPVRVGSKAVDLATTSQSEADENRGRAMRKRDDKIRKLQKKYNRSLEACNRGETAACAEASKISGEIEALRAER
ncbi:hypothetical protein [Novosphingobium sp. PASSN1]|uniref:hypothetical protein n=1 Tax=Novosphingobium sp. PASSN1 TaxID=2015561 RepID=UPI0025D95AAC|nr:hypothetical protein [Novosphingobium sp. PASSN1]